MHWGLQTDFIMFNVGSPRHNGTMCWIILVNAGLPRSCLGAHMSTMGPHLQAQRQHRFICLTNSRTQGRPSVITGHRLQYNQKTKLTVPLFLRAIIEVATLLLDSCLHAESNCGRALCKTSSCKGKTTAKTPRHTRLKQFHVVDMLLALLRSLT